MNFTNFVSTIAVIFAVGCSSSTEAPVSDAQGTTTEVVVEPVSVEMTPAVNETTTSADSTVQTTSTVTCPEGSVVVDGTCQTATVETSTSSH